MEEHFLTRLEDPFAKRESIDTTSEHHKLDVLSSQQYNRLVFVNMAILVVSSLYTVVAIVLANTMLLERVKLTYHNRVFELWSVKIPSAVKAFQVSFPLVLFIIIFPFTVVYCVRVCRNRRRRPTCTQWLVVLLLWACVLDNNPIPSITYIHDSVFFAGQPDKWLLKSRAFYILFALSWFVKISAFSIAQGYYVWAVAHSYRLTTGRPLGLRFHIFKAVPFLLQLILRIYGRYSHLKVLSSNLMFTTAASAISLSFRLPVQWSKDVISYIIGFTMIEAYILAQIIAQIIITGRVLHKLDYVEHRSRQIGFRFFVSQSLFYFGWVSVLDILLRVTVPAPHPLFFLTNFDLFNLDNMDFDAGVKLMIVTFVLVSAYTALPPDSKGVRGWFVGAEEEELHRLKPISLSLLERRDKFVDVQDHESTFVLETATYLFNFAWLSYDWQTKKHNRVSMTQKTFKFKPCEFIADEETDTNVLVIDARDRIVLSFRGTTSFENLKTDIQIARSPIASILPSTRNASHNMMQLSQWKHATAHSGFLKAYDAVSEKVVKAVAKLFHENKRPIFLTGHSLGGALATLCSLDLFIILDGFSDIYVVTFGSPKVGNSEWASLYDKYIPAHWRVSVSGDFITNTPKGGYKHCGKKAFITHAGDIFLDPSVLEMSARSRANPSIFFHKKHSYKIGLLIIADKYKEIFAPEIWDFPISKKDALKWGRLVMNEDLVYNLVGDDIEDDDGVTVPPSTLLHV